MIALILMIMVTRIVQMVHQAPALQAPAHRAHRPVRVVVRVRALQALQVHRQALAVHRALQAPAHRAHRPVRAVVRVRAVVNNVDIKEYPYLAVMAVNSGRGMSVVIRVRRTVIGIVINQAFHQTHQGHVKGEVNV